MKVKLNSVGRVRKFNSLAIMFDGELTLIERRYHVDAKSILGIFSLNLNDPIELEIECDDGLKREEFIRELERLSILEEV